LRHLGFGDVAFEGAVTRAEWPARMQRLKTGPLIDSAPGVELWVDGGHNPSAGQAISATLDRLPKRPTWLVCGMLNTKDIAGYMRPLAGHADGLIAVSIPGEAATLSAEDTAAAATLAGLPSETAGSVAKALARIVSRDPQARVLICGSLYLAGAVLRENG
jgi:dihydrofolate synthase/folylpolyglutamate synthase